MKKIRNSQIIMYIWINIIKRILDKIYKKIYVCGVFDLCHVSHKIHFEYLSKIGGKVYVGVHNDKVVESYKRVPYMTHDERCLAVSKCKYVDKVFPNAELNISKQFLIDNNIDIVACSDEYFNNPEDIYYQIPREMGILVEVKRDNTLSTTELINRIKKVENKNIKY